MNKTKYITLGFILAISLFASTACLKTTEQRSGVVFSQDMVLPTSGGAPRAITTYEIGEPLSGIVVESGTPVDEQDLIARFNRSSEEEVQAVEDLNPTPVTYQVEVNNIEGIAQIGGGLIATVGGPWGAAAGLLFTNLLVGWSRYNTKRKLSKSEDLLQNSGLIVEATFQAINDIRSSAKLIPDQEVGENIENGIVNLLRAAHKSANVINEVNIILQKIDSPYITSLSAENANSSN
jgi:hypothetical protein